MKYSIGLIPLVIIVALAVGYSSTRELKRSETASEGFDRVPMETREAARAIREYTYEQKSEFVEEMKRELVVVNKEMDRLSKGLENSGDEVKADARVRLKAVREKWEQAMKRLDQTESATESAWNDMKTGFIKSNDDLKESFNDSRQWVTETVNP